MFRSWPLLSLLALVLIPARAQAEQTTTIITHGFQFFGNKAPWVQDMAEEILSRTLNGTIFRYDPQTGRWDFVLSVSPPPHDNIILIFNWADESDGTFGSDWGFVQAAADALYAAIRNPIYSTGTHPDDLLTNRKIHLIGHSRGASVLSEVARRLGLTGFLVDQLTALDPHPLNGSFCESECDDCDLGDPVPTRWPNVNWADNYFRADGFPPTGCEFTLDPDGMPLPEFFNVDLTDVLGDNDFVDCDGAIGGICPCGTGCACAIEHILLHSWYHGTIDGDLGSCGVASWYNSTNPHNPSCLAWQCQGFYYSFLGGGTASRPPQPDSSAAFGNPPVLWHGDFEQGSVAGWRFHGGNVDVDRISVEGGDYYLVLDGQEVATHNRFALPCTAHTLSYSYRIASVAPGSNTLRVSLSDPFSMEEPILLDEISLDGQPLGNWIPRGVPIDGTVEVEREKTYTLTFELIAGCLAEVDIDNIGMGVLGGISVTLEIFPPEVPLDGQSVATLTATVTDGTGNPLSGVAVIFARAGLCRGDFRDCDTDQILPDPHTQITDANGEARTCYRGNSFGTCCFTATIGVASDVACVDFVAPTTCIQIIIEQQGANPSCNYQIRAEVTACATGDDIGYGQVLFSVDLDPDNNVMHLVNSDGDLGLEVCEDVTSGVADVDLLLADSVVNLSIRACFIADENAVCLESQSIVCVEPVFTFNCGVQCEFTDMMLSGQYPGTQLGTIDAGEDNNYLAALEAVSGGGSCSGRGVIVWDPYTWEIEWYFDDANGCWSSTHSGGHSLAYSHLPRNLADPRIVVSGPSNDWAELDPVTGLINPFDAPQTDGNTWHTEDTDLSPDGTRLWAIDDTHGPNPLPSRVGRFELAKLTMHPVEAFLGRMFAIAASNDGSRVAYTVEYDDPPPGGEAHLQIRNAQTLALIATPTLDIGLEPAGVAWSPDSQYVVADANGVLKVYTRDGDGPVAQFGMPNRVWSLAWSPDGNYIAAHIRFGDGVAILSWPSGIEVARLCGLEGQRGEADSVAWRGDSKVLAVTNASSPEVHVFAPFDQTDPQLFMTAPPDGLVIETDSVAEVLVSGQLTELAADDAGFPRAELGPALVWSIDGQPGGAEEVDANGNFSFTVPGLSLGTHEICVRGRDIAGNLSIERCRTVEVCGPPDVVVTVNNLPIFGGETVDFGTLQQGEGLVCRVFTMTNIGCQLLALSCPMLVPPFQVTQCPPAVLEQLEFGQMIICLDTSMCGSSIQSVSMETPLFFFNVTGTVVPPGDFDGDGFVARPDLLILLAAWGPCADCGNCPADIDGDCAVAVPDLLTLLANWGACP